MTVAQLSQHLTQEELVGWAAFYELRREEDDKARDQAKMRQGAQSAGRR